MLTIKMIKTTLKQLETEKRKIAFSGLATNRLFEIARAEQHLKSELIALLEKQLNIKKLTA